MNYLPFFGMRWENLITFIHIFSAEFILGTVEIDWPEQSSSFNDDKEDT